MTDRKFNPEKLAKLNNPQRLADISPEFIRSRLTGEAPRVLVDIGAGTGVFSVAFQHFFPAARVYACDLAEPMLAWMQEQVVPRHPGIVPVKSGESSIPLEDGLADLVFMITLHHELSDPADMLGESYRLLRPGGELFIVDWKPVDMPEGPPLAIRCQPDYVSEQMRRAGFARVRSHDGLSKHFLLTATRPLQA